MRRFGGVSSLVIALALGCQGPPVVGGAGATDAGGDAGGARDAAPVVPTWVADIGPLVHARCTGCHSDGGGAPFPLQTYEQVASIAGLVEHVVSARRMPPWPAVSSGDCQTYRSARWLSEVEIARVQSWVASGAPRGEGAAPAFERPPPPPFVASARLEAPEPYLVVPGRDDYRCFVAEPALATDRYLTAFRVALDQPALVHHIQLYALESPEEIEWARQQDADDDAPGFSCASVARGSYLEVWAQGDTVRRYPPGVGQRLAAGTALIYQLHYHPSAIPELDRTAVELELADEVARPARMRSFANRALALEPGMERVEVTGTHSLYFGDAEAVGVRLHMHELGADGRISIERPGASTCALDIPRWDFDWQLFYYFDESIPLANGDRLRLTCAYDTRSRDTITTWGTSTEDEMCLGYLLVAEPAR